MMLSDVLPLLPPMVARSWALGGTNGPVVGSPAALMGIVNVTPDSFSDGGANLRVEDAVASGQRLAAEGAAWIDVGGESSRPGAQPVPAALELARVVPVIAGLRERAVPAAISVDTTKAAVAAAALAAGARMVNDISAGADPGMFPLLAGSGGALVLMHMQGTPATMQQRPAYGDVVDEVIAFLAARLAAAVRAGVAESAIVLDPGIGFGKTVEHNLALLRALPRFQAELGRPLLVGISRKSFLARLAGAEALAGDRDGASHVLHALLAAHCALLRVHDVAGARAACALGGALRGGGPHG